MKYGEILLLALMGWTGIGIVGLTVSYYRGERERMGRGLAWLVSAWVVYMLALVAVSLRQPLRTISMGQPQCYGQMCFTVGRAEVLPGFLIRDGRRLIRVQVQVANRGPSMAAEEGLRAYLVDAQGRRWGQTSGVSGIGLSSRVASGDAIVSEPVFKVAGDSTGLHLVFSHGPWQLHRLAIGDAESVLHKPVIVPLPL